jgi:hypothetical protein
MRSNTPVDRGKLQATHFDLYGCCGTTSHEQACSDLHTPGQVLLLLLMQGTACMLPALWGARAYSRCIPSPHSKCTHTLAATRVRQCESGNHYQSAAAKPATLTVHRATQHRWFHCQGLHHTLCASVLYIVWAQRQHWCMMITIITMVTVPTTIKFVVTLLATPHLPPAQGVLLG